ncbi:hypothetical protein K458DRAFT_429828 [Lentithecium fluviatile CBS 122367]|uniref:DUF1996 domain-containing protein n=1 Tax=Lentithecium fluviatile CBS 122367 TaxID=1168545 RepID=A0A6G1J8R1_9PLEO|nr:hypothetical protein K458DRAFT_429828 [Lentithecium fluviatile CBS 122367]
MERDLGSGTQGTSPGPYPTSVLYETMTKGLCCGTNYILRWTLRKPCMVCGGGRLHSKDLGPLNHRFRSWPSLETKEWSVEDTVISPTHPHLEVILLVNIVVKIPSTVPSFKIQGLVPLGLSRAISCNDPRITGYGMTVYYFFEPEPEKKAQPFPEGFHMLAGNPFARSFTGDFTAKVNVLLLRWQPNRPQHQSLPRRQLPGLPARRNPHAIVLERERRCTS